MKQTLFLTLLVSILFILSSCDNSSSDSGAGTGSNSNSKAPTQSGPIYRGGENCSSDVISDYNVMANQNSFTNIECKTIFSEESLKRCESALEKSVKNINDFVEKYPQVNCKAVIAGEIKEEVVTILEEKLLKAKDFYEEALDKIRHN